MTEANSAVEAYTAEVDALVEADDRLSPLAAGILVAAHLDIAHDSIAFAKALDISHALVLREVESLASDLQLLEMTRRDPRTQRTYYALSVTARTLFQ
jgi:hypothetical protein